MGNGHCSSEWVYLTTRQDPNLLLKKTTNKTKKVIVKSEGGVFTGFHPIDMNTWCPNGSWGLELSPRKRRPLPRGLLGMMYGNSKKKSTPTWRRKGSHFSGRNPLVPRHEQSSDRRPDPDLCLTPSQIPIINPMSNSGPCSSRFLS